MLYTNAYSCHYVTISPSQESSTITPGTSSIVFPGPLISPHLRGESSFLQPQHIHDTLKVYIYIYIYMLNVLPCNVSCYEWDFPIWKDIPWDFPCLLIDENCYCPSVYIAHSAHSILSSSSHVMFV